MLQQEFEDVHLSTIEEDEKVDLSISAQIEPIEIQREVS